MAATVGQLILAVAACYLLGLGGMALVRPERAFSFLAGFAQTPRANWAEAIARFLAGLGAILAAPTLTQPIAWMVGGGFLIVTAVAMVLFPDAHRAFAARSVPAVRRFIPLIGVASIAFGLGLSAVLLSAR
jgi:hypothetical protein